MDSTKALCSGNSDGATVWLSSPAFHSLVVPIAGFLISYFTGGCIMKSAKKILEDIPREDRNFYIEMAAAAVVAAAFVLAVA
jgi:hypothetical protein